MDKNYQYYKWLEAEQVKPEPRSQTNIQNRVNGMFKRLVNRKLDQLDAIDKIDNPLKQ